jgi:hypothetical protein
MDSIGRRIFGNSNDSVIFVSKIGRHSESQEAGENTLLFETEVVLAGEDAGVIHDRVDTLVTQLKGHELTDHGPRKIGIWRFQARGHVGHVMLNHYLWSYLDSSSDSIFLGGCFSRSRADASSLPPGTCKVASQVGIRFELYSSILTLAEVSNIVGVDYIPSLSHDLDEASHSQSRTKFSMAKRGWMEWGSACKAMSHQLDAARSLLLNYDAAADILIGLSIDCQTIDQRYGVQLPDFVLRDLYRTRSSIELRLLRGQNAIA